MNNKELDKFFDFVKHRDEELKKEQYYGDKDIIHAERLAEGED